MSDLGISISTDLREAIRQYLSCNLTLQRLIVIWLGVTKRGTQTFQVRWLKAFFLALVTKDVIRASYAASFGKDKWEDTKWINSEDVKRLLSNFDFVSVRETSGLKLLKENFGVKDATQVLDPVLLFDDYPELTGKITSSDEIILYKLVNSAEFYTKCRNIGEHLSLPLRSIGSLRRIKVLDVVILKA